MVKDDLKAAKPAKKWKPTSYCLFCTGKWKYLQTSDLQPPSSNWKLTSGYRYSLPTSNLQLEVGSWPPDTDISFQPPNSDLQTPIGSWKLTSGYRYSLSTSNLRPPTSKMEGATGNPMIQLLLGSIATFWNKKTFCIGKNFKRFGHLFFLKNLKTWSIFPARKLKDTSVFATGGGINARFFSDSKCIISRLEGRRRVKLVSAHTLGPSGPFWTRFGVFTR